MEEINRGMERKEWWGNVRKQVQINLIQQKNKAIGLGGGLIVYILFVTLLRGIALYNSKALEYYSVCYGYSGFVWIGILSGILIPACQLFTNGAISMYPGNAITRFLGRCITDHIQIFIYLLCVAIAYMAQCGLLWLLLQGKTGVDISVIFDIRYLGVGLLRLGAYGMTLYGAFSLFLALDARFGNRFSIALLVVFFALMYYCIRYQPPFIMQVWGWMRADNTELFPCISIFLVIWLVCILASGILACYVRYWRIARTAEYIVICAAAFLACGVFVLTDAIDIRYEIEEENSVRQYGEEDLYCSVLIKLPENNTYDMNEEMAEVVDTGSGKKLGGLYQYINNENNLGFSIDSKSEAADIGIPAGVDLSGIDEEHGVLIFQLHDVQINGQYIYRDLVEDMQKNLRQVEDSSRIKLEYAGNLKSTICMDFFPSVERILYHGRRNMTMREYYNNQPYLLTTLLMSDTRYEAFEEWMDEELELDE
ncbi:MAG: hypothetical protein K2K70_03015 [Lachnospiraceae bacterium]|nr:hypothetical protein [Lachnospiraceae bacterium]